MAHELEQVSGKLSPQMAVAVASPRTTLAHADGGRDIRWAFQNYLETVLLTEECQE